MVANSDSRLPLETVEVHNSPNSRLSWLRPTVAAGFLRPTSKAAVHHLFSAWFIRDQHLSEALAV